MTESREREPNRRGPAIYTAADYPDLDAGIRRAVRILMENGVETFESCEGGKGHAYTEPTVRFYGALGAGWRALNVCLDYGLPIDVLNRTWPITRNEPTGPYWEIRFRTKVAEET